MAGNQNSGRKTMFKDPVQLHFTMEQSDVKVLNEIAEKFSSSNRSELIKESLKRVIESYERSK